MIARFLTASILVFGLTSFGYAQESVPAPAEAAITNASATTAAPAVAPAPAPAIIADPNAYRIGPEDLIEVAVWKDEELSRTVAVRPDGKITLLLINDIVAAGRTTDELRALVTEGLSKFINPPPEVSVIVKEFHSFKVSVLGRVRMPGQYEVKNGQARVLDMLARAQGFADFANTGSIRLIRYVNGKPTSTKFKYDDATRGVEGADLPVQPGDTIHVD